jgi:PIN like domain
VSTPTPPNGHPTFFIDRDLGRHAFPEGLRHAGLIVVTLAEYYGIPRDQEIPDHQWMVEAAQHGWPVLGCDSQHRRRRRPAERAVLIDAGVQNFILNGSVSAVENVERVVRNLAAILAACDTPGTFVYRVHPHRIERLPLD